MSAQTVRDKIALLSSLEKDMQDMIKEWAIWTKEDQHKLFVIKADALSAISYIFSFCSSYKDSSGNVFFIEKVKSSIASVFAIANPSDVSLSKLTPVLSSLRDFDLYLSCKWVSSSQEIIDAKKTYMIDYVNKELNGFKKLLNIESVMFLPKSLSEYLDPKRYAHLKEDRVLAILEELNRLLEKKSFFPSDLDDHTLDWGYFFIVKLKKIFEERRFFFVAQSSLHLDDSSSSGYLHTLLSDRGRMIVYLDFPEEITESNYQKIFREYADFLVSSLKNTDMEVFLNKRIGVYKSWLSRTQKKDWRWEAMILMQMLVQEKNPDELGWLSWRKKEKHEKEQEEKALLCEQAKYFPKVIELLEEFVCTFEKEHIAKSPNHIRTVFVDVYTRMVLEPLTNLDSKIFGQEDLKSLSPKHWKSELYVWIPHIVSSWSDDRIKASLSRWFFFGDILDLINRLKDLSSSVTPQL